MEMYKFTIVTKFVCLFKKTKTETGFSKSAESCPYFFCNLLSPAITSYHCSCPQTDQKRLQQTTYGE